MSNVKCLRYSVVSAVVLLWHNWRVPWICSYDTKAVRKIIHVLVQTNGRAGYVKVCNQRNVLCLK